MIKKIYFTLLMNPQNSKLKHKLWVIITRLLVIALHKWNRKKIRPTFLLTDQLDDFGEADKKDECIATTICDGKKFDRGYEECTKSYHITCGNKLVLKNI